ncbi:uncharacterized protein BYT42DRAFT_551138 [Radiomyces spectabilis]|uniref:uncharacterized protein n=1 Tax=Radiomyces spectabilis TaxID=64574 RepID=UPI00221EC293|nr:uncharacterized protein BYT42DRAFT_551138 [Radiomyces spectabilis]KAI8393468.1 hypothetical protein BYT42DRAFT_551138 [Radiomyces spectabilis]
MAPARKQIDKATLEAYQRERRPEGGTYNIWHNRYSGLEKDWSKRGLRAKFKCNPAKDSGETAGSRNPHAYFCLYFAKGMCSQGAQCSMWHRIPNENDEVQTTIDCFGRDKFTEFREDMGGVGGFNTSNRTLYVGRIAVSDSMEEVVRRHFSPFGNIERIRILKHRGVAFVTYTTRSNAEFAREAMMSQSLDHNEIINVRWATEDPNAFHNRERAQEEVQKRRHDQELAESHETQEGEADLPAEYTYLKRDTAEDEFDEMEDRVKRQKAEEVAREHTPYYDTASAAAIYGFEQVQAPPVPESYPSTTLAPQTATQPSVTKPNSIIPLNVLESLKSIQSKESPVPAKSTQSSQPTGLGSLANYGSDDEDDDDE